jgi:hypothetical protein
MSSTSEKVRFKDLGLRGGKCDWWEWETVDSKLSDTKKDLNTSRKLMSYVD